MVENRALVDQLRALARRYEPRSPERVAFMAAAESIESFAAQLATAVEKRVGDQAPITPDAVEAAMGGRKLFPWQRKALGQ